MKSLLPLLALALSIPAPALAGSSPQALLCPPTAGDLEYGIDQALRAAKFQRHPDQPGMWRKRADGPFDLASLEKARWFVLELRQFRTQRGVFLVAEMSWETGTWRFEATEKAPAAAIQQFLDGLEGIFPC